jgi:hypothetical protein
MSRRFGLLFSLCLVLVTVAVPPAQAIGPIIAGIVRDIVGNPLGGATIYDGHQSTQSSSTPGSVGAYSLTETSPGTYSLVASKSGYVSGARTVNTLTNTADDKDFSLLFVLTPGSIQRYFTSTPQTIPLSVTSLAPQDTTMTVTIGSTVVTLSYSSINGQGVRTWTGSYGIAAGTPDQNFTAVFKAMRAGIAIAKSPTGQDPAVAFTLDTLAPVFSLWAPASEANEQAKRPLIAVTASDLSGINPST